MAAGKGQMDVKRYLLLFCTFIWMSIADDEYDWHDFHYSVQLELETDAGLLNSLSEMIVGSEIKAKIEGLRLFKQQGEIVSNIYALKERIAKDVESLERDLHIAGYYNAVVECKLNKAENNTVNVVLKVQLNRIFGLNVHVVYTGHDAKFTERHGNILQLRSKQIKASINEIVGFIDDALLDLKKSGYYAPTVIQKRLRVLYDRNKVLLLLEIDPGEKVVFGDTTIHAFDGIDDQFIRNRISWRTGKIFDIGKIKETEEALHSTQIFSKIKIEEGRAQNGIVPIALTVKEEKKHMLNASIFYSTERNNKVNTRQNKFGTVITRFSWTRFNAFGGGEKLETELECMPIRLGERHTDYGFMISCMQPDFLFNDSSITYEVSRKQELTNAFFRKVDHYGFVFSKPGWKNLVYNIGCCYEQNYVDIDYGFWNDRHYQALVIPFGVVFDKTDSLLDPTKGYRFTINSYYARIWQMPTNRLLGLDIAFAYNYSFNDVKQTVFAFNVERHNIFGCSSFGIPLDKRVYCGGSSSVRGYANQMATCLSDGIPIGGKYSWEFNAELRRKVTSTIGGALFFDGGKVFHHLPRKRWFFSYGVGVRYFTSIGPIRFDFAFPVHRRSDVDSRVRFMMSLGQAF